MKNSLNIETLEMSKTLTIEEQNTFRMKFKSLLKLAGIISLCLEEKELYVEFNQSHFNLDFFKVILVEMGLPLKFEGVQA